MNDQDCECRECQERNEPLWISNHAEKLFVLLMQLKIALISHSEAQTLYESMEGCCDSEGMNLIRDILKRFDPEFHH